MIELSLQDNQLSGEIPAELGNPAGLEGVNLGGMQLSNGLACASWGNSIRGYAPAGRAAARQCRLSTIKSTFTANWRTESAPADLVRLYRDGLNHPSWNIIDEGSSGDFGWFSWSVHDTGGRQWHGRLVVAPLHEGWKQVWLSLYANDADTSQ